MFVVNEWYVVWKTCEESRKQSRKKFSSLRLESGGSEVKAWYKHEPPMFPLISLKDQLGHGDDFLVEVDVGDR